MWTKEQYKARAADTYHRCEEWFKGPWWFKEKEPVAKFTGWVMAYTGLLAIVAALQLCTLERTDQTLHKTLVTANRAWLAPLEARLDGEIVDGETVKVKLSVINTGRGPAFDVIARGGLYTFSALDFEPKGLDFIDAAKEGCALEYYPRRNRPVYFPQNVYPIHADESAAFPGQPIRGDDALRNGEKVLTAHGCVAYRTFDNPRHSMFCYFFRKGVNPAKLEICPRGHYAD